MHAFILDEDLLLDLIQPTLRFGLPDHDDNMDDHAIETDILHSL